MKLPETLYHGTSDGYLEAILRDGLRPESSGTGYLCYTDEIEVALHHAACMAEWDESMLGRACRPVVFAVPIGSFDTGGFVLEEGFIRNGPSAGRACVSMEAARIRERHERRPWSWDELLVHAGAVGYARTLKVTVEMILAPDDPRPWP